MDQSFAGKVTRINTMIAAIKTADAAVTRHLPEGFIEDMEKRYQSLMTLDAEHEAVKSRLKEMTIEVETQLAELDRKFRYAKNIVKLELPQESWLAYGCPAKR